MKKKLNQLMFGLMATSFLLIGNACSKDDDPDSPNEGGGVNSGAFFKPTTIKNYTGYEEFDDAVKFTYDSEGNLTRYKDTSSDGNFAITYDPLVIQDPGYTKYADFTYDDRGRVTSVIEYYYEDYYSKWEKTEKYTMQYDGDYLVKYTASNYDYDSRKWENPHEVQYMEWTNGNMTKRKSYWVDSNSGQEELYSTDILQYSTLPARQVQYAFAYDLFDTEPLFILYMMRLVGAIPNNLVSASGWESSNGITMYRFEYKMNSNGSINEEIWDPDDPEIRIYTY